MKTNSTHLNSSALTERRGEIACVSLGLGFMPAYPAQDWNLPIMRYNEQGALTPH